MYVYNVIVNFVNRPEWGHVFNSYRVEAAWKLGDWGCLEQTLKEVGEMFLVCLVLFHLYYLACVIVTIVNDIMLKLCNEVSCIITLVFSYYHHL